MSILGENYFKTDSAIFTRPFNSIKWANLDNVCMYEKNWKKWKNKTSLPTISDCIGEHIQLNTILFILFYGDYTVSLAGSPTDLKCVWNEFTLIFGKIMSKTIRKKNIIASI